MSGSSDEAYYYIDDVRVILCDSVISVNEIKNDLKISLFPNPSNGMMQLDYDLKNKQKGVFIIYDVLGKKVAEYELEKESTTLTINEVKLKAGVYFYKVMMDNEVVKSDKLVIIK